MTTTSPDTQPTRERELSPLRRRVRQAAGQVLAIDRMLGEDRSCEDVLIQLAAVQGALRAIGQHILACHLTDALGAVSTGDLPAPAAAEDAAYLAGLLANVSSPRSGALPAGQPATRPVGDHRRTVTEKPRPAM
ncbi:metal-sensitive transcriptional regulator [Amycolatopsis sp. NPDC059657]|uniref:metal-sensitive transcriptional regulator n=1 Tax=Amycolatopsis sp. NPDC059657 TaxID=3346899 RepID=UPI00366BFC5F